MSFEQDDDDQYGQSYDEVMNSYTKGFLDGEDNPDGDKKPKIIILGLKRSGKSSIEKVVFQKLSPNETLFLGTTTKIIKHNISNSALVNFELWDIPDQMDLFENEEIADYIFHGCGAVIYVIDAQDSYLDSLNRLYKTVTRAYKANPFIKFEVFIHKVDGLTEDSKIEAQRDIHQRATVDLSMNGFEHIHLSFHLTSIYDHSIFEAFSKVVQKLIPELPSLENFLSDFILRSSVEKAFLFDVVSKIYIATDPSPVDMQSYELCCDMIDVVIDISGIYGMGEDGTEDDCAFDSDSSCTIRLNNGMVLYLRQVNHFLALVCILRDDSLDRQGVLDYNFLIFRSAFREAFELNGSTKNTPLAIKQLAPEANIQNSIKELINGDP